LQSEHGEAVEGVSIRKRRSCPGYGSFFPRAEMVGKEMATNFEGQRIGEFTGDAAKECSLRKKEAIHRSGKKGSKSPKSNREDRQPLKNGPLSPGNGLGSTQGTGMGNYFQIRKDCQRGESN